MSGLRLYLLGSPRIALGDEDIKFCTRKNMALVAYLAITGHSHSREALSTLLWPESDPSHARAGLRRNLSMLKKALGGAWLKVDRDSIGTDSSVDFYLDVRQFRHYLAAWQGHGHSEAEICAECFPILEQAVSLYHDDFMAGFSLRDSHNFDEWQFFQAEELRREAATTLARLVHGLATQGAYEPAINYARRWLTLDPFHEPAHQYLMQLYAWSGQHAAALRQFSECERILAEELGIEPAAETIQLHQAIRDRDRLPRFEERLVTPVRSDILNNRYRLDSEIGRGSQGIVYRGRDLLLDREVAVKVYSTADLGLQGRKRLIEEAQTAARLNHQNIVSIYDAGESNSTSYTVSEFTHGQPLKDYHPLSIPEIVGIARQICAGLAHAHQQGVVHRDLKPENIIITGDGQAKLTDFGLARSIVSRIDQDGAIRGPVYYLAPELALGKDFDGRADLYSLGVILYELTTGCLPFDAADSMAIISLHLHAVVVPPRAKNGAIPPKLDALIVRLMSKNPDNRPSSAAELLGILEHPSILAGHARPLVGELASRQIGSGQLVGRDRHLRQMRQLWNRVITGLGQTILVSGDDGLGKSRLVQDLATHVQVTGGLVLQGNHKQLPERPLAPYTRIIHQVNEQGLLDGLHLPDFILADLMTLAPSLRPAFPTIHPNPTLDDPLVQRERLFENLAFFLDALSCERPLLLVIENLQWADSSSLLLLRHLCRQARQRRILITITCPGSILDDNGSSTSMLVDLCRQRLAHQIHLSELNRSETRELLTMLLAEEVRPEFLDGIYAETQGNPFFIEEVCRVLVESGQLYITEGRWGRPSRPQDGIPQNIQAAINARFRSLPVTIQDTLMLAALLGDEFHGDTLLTATELDEQTLVQALDQATIHHFISPLGPDSADRFRFSHSMISATLVDLCQGEQCLHCHRRIAAALEATQAEESERLSYHFLEAGESELAIPYLFKAGDRARTFYADGEAVEYYKQAQKILESTQDYEALARIHTRLGITFQNAADFRASRASFRNAFEAGQIPRSREAVPPAPAPHPLRILLADPGSVIPGLATNITAGLVSHQLFSCLVIPGLSGSMAPDIAASWELEDSGRRILFHLRDDIYWSDGIRVTARDFECAWSLEIPSATMPWIRETDALHRQGFAFEDKAESPYHDWVNVQSLDQTSLAIEGQTSAFLSQFLASVRLSPLPRHIIQRHGQDWMNPEKLVTNGPFRIIDWQPGERLALERYPAYHGHFAGNARQVECHFSKVGPFGALARYRQDDIDICLDLPPLEWARARQHYAEEYYTGPWLSTRVLVFNTNRPPFNDRRFRQAIALATNREALAHIALRGYVFPATGGVLPPGVIGHSPDLARSHDPGSAASLLADSGFFGQRASTTLNCLASDDPGNDLLADCLSEQWSETLGIESDWRFVSSAGILGRERFFKDHLLLVSQPANTLDPLSFLGFIYRQLPGWRNHHFQECLAAASHALDLDQQAQITREAEEILCEQVPLFPLCYGRFHMLAKPWVGHYPGVPYSFWSWKDITLEPHT